MSKLIKNLTIALVLFIGITACTSKRDIKTTHNKSSTVKMKAYKTYQIVPGSGSIDNLGRSNGLDLTAEVRQTINHTLAKKHKVMVVNSPDFYVAYTLGNAGQLQPLMDLLNEAGRDELQARLSQANIILVLIDANTGAIIDIATAAAHDKGESVKKQKKRLHYAIKRMLRGV